MQAVSVLVLWRLWNRVAGCTWTAVKLTARRASPSSPSTVVTLASRSSRSGRHTFLLMSSCRTPCWSRSRAGRFQRVLSLGTASAARLIVSCKTCCKSKLPVKVRFVVAEQFMIWITACTCRFLCFVWYAYFILVSWNDGRELVNVVCAQTSSSPHLSLERRCMMVIKVSLWNMNLDRHDWWMRDYDCVVDNPDISTLWWRRWLHDDDAACECVVLLLTVSRRPVRLTVAWWLLSRSTFVHLFLTSLVVGPNKLRHSANSMRRK